MPLPLAYGKFVAMDQEREDVVHTRLRGRGALLMPSSAFLPVSCPAWLHGATHRRSDRPLLGPPGMATAILTELVHSQ